MWRWTALVTYLIICVYDFVVVPVWYGLNSPNVQIFIDILNTVEDPLIQLELMKKSKVMIKKELKLQRKL